MCLAVVAEVVSGVMLASRPRAPGVGTQGNGRKRRLLRSGAPDGAGTPGR